MPGIKSELFGDLAIKAKIITREQLDECLRLQEEMRRIGSAPPKLGELLEEKGYLTKAQLKSLLDSMGVAEKRRFGEIAVSLHLVSPEELEGCLMMQQFLRKTEDKVPFKGEYLSAYQKLLDQSKSTGVIPRIGEVMVEMQILKPHQVDMVLEQQQKIISRCKTCNAVLNISKFKPGQKVKCGQCGVILEVTTLPDGSLDTGLVEEKEQAEIVERRIDEKVTFGDYKVLQKLGQDGTGILYKARQLSKNRDVVLKVFNKTTMSDKKFAKKLLDDARRVSKFDHANIKKVYSIGKADGFHYLTMEYVEAESIHNVLERERKIPYKRAIEIAVRVAEALEYSHGRGVIHGDIRPSNLLMLKNGEIRVSNLGMATRTIDNILFIAKSSGMLVPFYIAPEQVMENRPIDARTDIYSLGAAVFHMIAGKPPYEGRSPFEIMVRFTEETRPPLKFYDASIPDPVAKTIDKMLEAEPDDRYQTMHDVLLDLRRLELLDHMAELPAVHVKIGVAELPTEAPPKAVTPKQPILKPRVINPAYVVTAVILAAIAIALAAFQLTRHLGPSSTAQKALEQQKKAMENFRKDYERAIDSMNEFKRQWSHIENNREWAQAQIEEINRARNTDAETEFASLRKRANDMAAIRRYGDAIRIWSEFPGQLIFGDWVSKIAAEKRSFREDAERAFRIVEEAAAMNVSVGEFDEAIIRYQEVINTFGIDELVERAKQAIAKIEKQKAATPPGETEEERQRREHERKLKQAEIVFRELEKVYREAIDLIVVDGAIEKIQADLGKLYDHWFGKAEKLIQNLKIVGDLKKAVMNRIRVLQWEPNAQEKLTVKFDRQSWLITGVDQRGIYVDNQRDPKLWKDLLPEELNGIMAHFMEGGNPKHWFALAIVNIEKGRIADEAGDDKRAELWLMSAGSHLTKAKELGQLVDEEMNYLLEMCNLKARKRSDEAIAFYQAGDYAKALDVLLNIEDVYTKTACYRENREEILRMIETCCKSHSAFKKDNSSLKFVSFADSDASFFTLNEGTAGGKWFIQDGYLVARKVPGLAEKDFWRLLAFGGMFKACDPESKVTVSVGSYYVTLDFRSGVMSYGNPDIGVMKTVREINGRSVTLEAQKWYMFIIEKTADANKVNFYFQGALIGSLDAVTKLDVVKIKSESATTVLFDNFVICEPKP